MARVKRLEDDNLRIVEIWLVSRLMLAVIAVSIAIINTRSLESVVAQWDVAHFVAISAQGYADPKEIAFFPGWPLILHALGLTGIPKVLGGTIVALVCSLVAAFALKRIAGPWGAIAWLLAPTAVFTAVPYTESPSAPQHFGRGSERPRTGVGARPPRWPHSPPPCGCRAFSSSGRS